MALTGNFPDISSYLDTWKTFYAFVGGASATLVGLLFVGISMHLDKFRQGMAADVKALSGRSFSGLLYVVTLSAVFLIPHETVGSIGTIIICMGAIGFVNAGLLMRHSLKHQSKSWSDRYIVRQFVLLIVTFAGMLAIGILTLSGFTVSLDYMPVVIINLIVFSSRNAWNMLLVKDAEHPRKKRNPDSE